jgi:ABC-2 type transport system ATP-binding protein
MTAAVVTTVGLTKQYGDTTALDRVDFTVPKGAIYGLVGPNGAGKTTLLGILAGLRTPTSGTATVNAASVRVLPDTPKFDPWLTAREVVELARTLTAPGSPVTDVDEVLDAAGLLDNAGRRVRGFSRGMLQRLGIAAAVVGDPDLLLLDEPAAALDPAGRREVLDLIERLRGRATMVFSSHILDDVQQVSDEIGILRRGSLIYQGSLEGLLAGRRATSYVITMRSDHEAALSALAAASWTGDAVLGDDGILRVVVNDLEVAERELVPLLAGLGAPIVSVQPHRESLEDVFLEVTR